jgi:2-hydroxychromene-2-carboxylate isomerase
MTLEINAMTSRIRFYFDYESPNAYLAWTQLPKVAHSYGPGTRLHAGGGQRHGAGRGQPFTVCSTGSGAAGRYVAS